MSCSSGAGRYTEANAPLAGPAKRKPTNATLWYWLAEIQGLAGNAFACTSPGPSTFFRPSTFFLNGDMPQALQQLDLARRLATDNVTLERIEQRARFFQRVGQALGQV